MTQSEFKSMLIENGIDYVKVICTPDFRCGYDPVVYFNDKARKYKLNLMQYVEFEGDIDKAVENYNTVFESAHSNYAQQINYYSLEQLVEEKIYEREQCSYISPMKPYYNPLRSLRSRVLLATKGAKRLLIILFAINQHGLYGVG